MENANTKLIYHPFRINEDLLNQKASDFEKKIEDARIGSESDNVPGGKVLGLYFISYGTKLRAWDAIDYKHQIKTPSESSVAVLSGRPDLKAFVCSHTSIQIKRNQGVEVTPPTDLRDFNRDNWSDKGYKELPFTVTDSEKITINWKTQGNDFPPCGEFIFIIEALDTCPI